MGIYRITPAYAGNTSWCVSRFRTYKDHPRLRGEHISICRYRYVDSGSPPLTRGTRCGSFLHPVCGGITPAYAGNTLVDKVVKVWYRDHPRLRGEHSSHDTNLASS